MKKAFVAVMLASLCAVAAQAAPYMFEDFQGYPPAITNDFPVPTGFIAVHSASENQDAQFFDHSLWDDVEQEGIIRWRIGRTYVPGSNQHQRRLVYVGTDPQDDPMDWENYTVRAQFETPVDIINRIHIMARLQGNTAASGYTAVWNVGVNAADDYNYHLLIKRDGFHDYSTTTDTASLLAASTDSYALATNTVYTLEFTVQGSSLTANLYLGTDLEAENALKLTASASDTSYTAGAPAIGYRAQNDSQEVFFHQMEVIPEPAALALFGLAGLILALRRRPAS